MSGARAALLVLLLAAVAEGGPGAAAELTAGGPREAARRDEAAAPHRASDVRAVRGGARSPLLVAGGLPGRPTGAGSSSRLGGGRWAGAASHRRGCPAGQRSRGSSGQPRCSAVSAVAAFVGTRPESAAGHNKALGGR